MAELVFLGTLLGFIFLGLVIAYTIVPINWRNTAARKYLLAQVRATNAPSHVMRLDVEQAIGLAFHQDIRNINSCIMANDQSWAFANVTIDFVDSGEEPSYWKAETSYNVFVRRLASSAPEIALDHRYSSSINPMYAYSWKIRNGELIYCEAAFMDEFKTYCHPGQEAEVLSLLAPDALLSVLDNMTGTDMYIVDEYFFCIMPNFHVSQSKIQRIFESSATIVRELNTNLPRTQYRK